MLYLSSGKAKKMALNGLERSFMNDSLEDGDWKRSVVAPESSFNGDTDFNAFSPTQEELYLGLFPNWMVNMVQDKANWKNRVAGISKIQSVIDSVPDKSLPRNSDLAAMLEFVSSPINDSHFKVNQMALELLESVVKKLGKRIKPHIPNLVSTVLVKMGSNKYLIKQAGMRLMMELMRTNGPELVVREIVNSGVHYKTSRVREESLNTITAALLTFPASEFHLIPLMRDLAPSMTDNKPKVRQASFDVMSVICDRVERTDLKEVVAAVTEIDETKTVWNAFQIRIARHCLPSLNADGLVEPAIPVANSKVPNHHIEDGLDTDWILYGSKVQSNGTDASKSQQPSYSNQRKNSLGTSMFRPYRSAGKRLPWELEQTEETVIPHSIAPLKPPEPPFPFNHSLSPKHYPPSTTAGGVKKTSGSYAKMHLDRIARTPTTTIAPIPTTPTAVSVNGSLSNHHPSSIVDPIGGALHKYSSASPLSSTLPPRMTPSISKQRPPLPVPMSKRHNSIPDSGFNSGSGSSVGYIPTSIESSAPTSMSVTWPRAPLPACGSMHVSNGVGPQSVRMSQQISADAAGLVAGVHSSVKTSMSRPLSKPRVRNPLTLLKEQNLKHTSSGTLIPSLGGSSPKQTESPTQLERDFLTSNNVDSGSVLSGWGECSFDEEEYNKIIPEDTTVLNSSLSASLSSLCNGREVESARVPGEFDKLHHIRKEAASRKAQLLSAATSASNSPEALRHASGEAKPKKKGSKPSKPVVSKLKWDTTDGAVLPSQSIDLNRTYTTGTKEEKLSPTYSMAFLAKKQGTPTRTSRAISQVKRERPVPVEESSASITHEISLEGVSLDKEGKESQPKKKSRKVDPPKGNLPPPRLRSNSLSHDGSIERRPSIEKGGTNTIDMEVSGVGSQSKAGDTSTTNSATLGQLSQTTKESLMRKKQKQQDDEMANGHKAQSASYSTNKKPPIPPLQDTVTTSAPVENVRKRNKRKNHVNSNGHQADSSPDETPKYSGSLNSSRRNSITISDVDSSINGGSSDELVELHPFNNPEQGLRDSIQNIGSDDWSSKCAGMMGVRRVAMYNPEVLQPQLHTVILAVEKEVKNLRSSVARAAIACLGDLFATMRRSMEQDLDSVVRVLLFKTGESNAFIREDVEKVFNEMIGSVSFSKCLTALLNGGLTHRSSQIRKTMSKFVFASVDFYGASKLLHSSKDTLERALPAIIQMITDSSQEVRYNGRKCLNLLWPQPEFEKIASRVLNGQQFTKAKDTIEHLKVKGLGDSPSENQSAKQRHSNGGSTRSSGHSSSSKGANSSSLAQSGSSSQSAFQESTTTTTTSSGYSSGSTKSRRIEVSGAVEMALPDGLLDHLKASSWSERFEAVTELEEFVTTYPYSLGPHLHKVFDVFSPRLTDRNSKVNLHALEAFSNMVPMLCNILVPVINNVVSALVPNLASRNATIHSMAMTVLDLLSQCVDPIYLIQPIANNGQYGNARVQPIMIKKLAELTGFVYGQKPHSVSRQVLPVMWHLISGKVPATSETKAATLTLCESLWQCMGQNFLDSASHLSPEHRKKLDELISSLERR